MEGQQIWNKVYGEGFMTIWSPPEGTVQFTARHLKKRLTADRFQELFPAKRVLDLGCGNGAAVSYFSKMGYEAFGIDLSAPAIEIGKEWFAREGLTGDLRVGSAAETLPFTDGYFDVVTSFGVLDHMMMDNAKRAISEVDRVLTKPGRFFVTLADTQSKKFGDGTCVGRNSYILEGDWYETGAVQHYFDERDIRELLGNRFRIIDIRRVVQEKYNPEFQQVYWSSRWHVVAEKA